MNVAITIKDQPSNSKGWARYRLTAAGAPVVTSRTGNEWISSDKACEVEDGTELILTLQCQLTEGKSRKRTTYTQEYRLVAGGTTPAEIVYRPASQGITVAVAGAEVAS